MSGLRLSLLSCLVLVLCAGPALAGTVYTSVANGAWTWTDSTWSPSNGSYPQNADDVVYVNNYVWAVPDDSPVTAYLNSGGMLVFSYQAIATMHLNGGTINENGYGYGSTTFDPVLYLDAPSSIVYGGAGNDAHPVILHGSSSLSLGWGGYNLGLTANAGSDFTGTIIASEGNVGLGGTFLSDANAVLDAKAGAGFYSSGNTVLHCALRGSGSYASSGWAASLTIGAGGKVSPGAAGADAATFTFNMSAGDAQRVILGAGSTTVIDVISPGLADLVNGTGYMTIDPAARLDVYLPTPGAETTISNLPIITNATPITGTFSPGLVSLNVVGWDGLSVTKSADGTQILLSAHYVPEPLTLGLLAIGALAIRRGRKA